MDPSRKADSEQTAAGRNYGGVRITAPPRRVGLAGETPGELGSAVGLQAAGTGPGSTVTSDQQAKILTGAALFGVLAIVLLHEFGHWIAGLAVTGQAPDFLVVAVRQKVSEFSTAGGVITWGAGPFVHIVALWSATLFVIGRARSHPRLFTATGAAILFTVVAHTLIWASATFTSPESWENDLPRVATFSGSAARLWMHASSAAFMAAVILAGYLWLEAARSTGKRSLFLPSTLMGAAQGGILVLIGTFFVAVFN